MLFNFEGGILVKRPYRHGAYGRPVGLNRKMSFTPAPSPGAPPTPQEAVEFIEQNDGSCLVKGVTFIQQADGSVLWSGAAFTENTDGSYMVS